MLRYSAEIALVKCCRHRAIVADGAACLAIFLSGGSMAPAEQEVPVNPAPGSFGQAVAGAVLIAALCDGPQKFEERLSALLQLAEAAAAGETIAPETPA